MGTSLGYGQGTEYQYFEPPQPSQPMARLRQERLQQLREERMHRQQQRLGDITSMIERGDRKGKSASHHAASPTAVSPQQSPSWGPNASPWMVTPVPPSPLPQPPAQVSPTVSAPAQERSPISVSTTSPSTLRSRAISDGGVSAGGQLQATSTPSQDTGVIQRARIGRAATILMGAFIASRILGLLRTTLFLDVFGADQVSDAFVQAMIIPDLIFNIVAGGALSSAFIPVFTTYMVAEKDEKKAWHLASTALNLAIAVMMCLAFIVMIFAPHLVPLYNLDAPPQKLDLIASLTRIMLFQAIALGAGVIVWSVLNAKQNFLLPAIGTVVYNVGLILGLIPGLFLHVHCDPRLDVGCNPLHNEIIAVYFAAGGVVLGALFQVGVQVPGLVKLGMRYSFSFDWRAPGVIQIARRMAPRILNAGMLSFSVIVDRNLILLLAVVVGQNQTNGLVTQYVQAFTLMMLPLGVFGMAVSTAAFPTLAEHVVKGRFDRLRSTILETVRSILFLSIPSSVGLMMLSLPVIQVLYEHGAFDLNAAESTAVPVALFAIGLSSLAAVEILTRSFYVLGDTKTPVYISVSQFIFKIALSLLMINFFVWLLQALAGFPRHPTEDFVRLEGAWGMGGLAFSTSIAGLVEGGSMLWLLNERIGGLQLRALTLFVGRVLVASLAMAVGLFVTRFLLDTLLVTTTNLSLGLGGTILAFIKLLLEIGIGTVIYLRCAHLLNIEELGPIKRVLDRLKLSWI
jgi:putative peptidoglycan lipid II flippase